MLALFALTGLRMGRCIMDPLKQTNKQTSKRNTDNYWLLVMSDTVYQKEKKKKKGKQNTPIQNGNSK